MLRLFLSTAFVAVLFFASPAWAKDEYRQDDGVGDINYGVQGGGTRKASVWLNTFKVEVGKEVLTSLDIAYGSIPVNTVATAYIWGDFNNDGNPSDAFVLGSLAAPIISPNGPGPINAFQNFDISDLTLPVGTTFFAGTIINNYNSLNKPMRYDNDGTDSIPTFLPNHTSWIAAHTNSVFASIDPNNLAATQLPLTQVTNAFGQDGTWLIRVNASPAVPEPSTWMLLVFGGGTLITFQKRFIH